MFKQLYILLLIFICSTSAIGQKDTDVLMTVADKPITVEEFKYIYEKNNGDKADYSARSLKEYLDLYTKFKLKVAKAKDLQMDTIQSLKDELNTYKRQLANSYLMDKEVLAFLVQQLYARTKDDVKISHIYVTSNRKMTKEQDAEALSKIQEAKSKLDAGMSFSQVAKDYSMDKNNNMTGGTLGYFTAMMPSGFYELENAMYDTPIGEVSGVIKTNIGYHIVKPEQKRTARGKINVAHILIKKANKQARNIADQIVMEIKNGLQFEEAVLKYSEDPKTKNKGGVLPELGINMYDLSFEDAVFALKEDGQVSDVIETKIGYHIVKRINKPEALDFNTFKKVFEPRIKKDERYQTERSNLIADIKKTAKYTRDDKVYEAFKSKLDATFLSYKWSSDLPINKTQTLAVFGGDVKYSLNDFAEFCKKNTRTRLKYDKTKTTPTEVADILYESFIDDKAIDYEQGNLETKYADFRSLMREYDEGILLFEVTKDAVWDKANEDTIGLQTFYEKNSNRYMTGEQADLQMVFIQSNDESLANKIKKYFNKKGLSKTIKKFNKKEEIVSSFSEKLEQSNPQFNGMAWEEGAVTEMTFDKEAKRYVIKKITKKYAPSVKPLKQARGYIVADYQDYLEKEWIAALKAQFPVSINKDVLKKLTK